MSSTPPSASKYQKSEIRSQKSELCPPCGSAVRLPHPVRITEQVWPEGTVPVVSICCITYQHVNFIRDAVEGFLMQETTFPVEIIIRDDASTDGTAEIVKEYAEKYPKLIRTILHTENQYSKGKKAFPETRAMARGEFIALCEGDDYWISKEKLQKQVEVLGANPDIALVFHNAEIINTRHGNKISYLIHKSHLKQIHKTKDLLKGWYIPTASIVYRNYQDWIFPEWYYNCQSGDIPLLLLLSLKGSLYYIPEVMSVYRMHPDGISTSHVGYSKAIGMIYTYESFNFHTGKIFSKEIFDAIIYEIESHLPYMKDYLEMKKEIKNIKLLSNRPLWRRLGSEIKKSLKSNAAVF